MRSLSFLIAAGLLTSTATAETLWDNFQGPTGFDGKDSLSSERNTSVPESWTVDDAVFSVGQFPFGVRITGLRWIGVRTAGAMFPAADFAILDSGMNRIPVPNDLDTDQVYSVETTLPSDAFPNLEVYRGFVDVPDVELAPGSYFFGVRLVGNSAGRSFIATTGDGVVQGDAQGSFQSQFFGFDDFVPASDAFKASMTDFAFQIEGTPLVPEPMTAMLVLSGLALALRRR